MWAERERAQLATEVKTLTGLLPICSGCKRIRDRKTDLWHSVESYVTQHSEATFTHSLCPDCLKEYFPDYKEAEE